MCGKWGILQAFTSFKNDGKKKGKIPELWDGRAAKRLVEILIKDLNPKPLNLER